MQLTVCVFYWGSCPAVQQNWEVFQHIQLRQLFLHQGINCFLTLYNPDLVLLKLQKPNIIATALNTRKYAVFQHKKHTAHVPGTSRYDVSVVRQTDGKLDRCVMNGE